MSEAANACQRAMSESVLVRPTSQDKSVCVPQLVRPTSREDLSGTTKEQKEAFQNSNGLYNPKPQEMLPPGYADQGTQGDKLVIALVGLPARGKTYIANKVKRYLNFFHGAPCEVFNVGNYRRKKYKCAPSKFFDKENEEGLKMRMDCAEAALQDCVAFINAGMEKGRVAVFDATNCTRARRQWLVDQLKPTLQSISHVIFVESVCEDPVILENNIRASMQHMPDYQDMSEADALADFESRISNYKRQYDTLDQVLDKEFSWIKTVDGGQQVVLNKIFGYLPGRIASFVMNLHTSPKTICLSRHGQSEYNLVQKIGGDSSLTAHGIEYARALAEWVHKDLLPTHPRTRLWTSTLRRTIETGSYIKHTRIEVDGRPWITMRPRQWHALDEIHAGIFDGMTYAEVESVDPEEFKLRKLNKLSYRYPRGESYVDVIQRLDTIIHELERQRDPVLIIAHQGILRILYGYFMWTEIANRDKCTNISIPLNTVKQLKPHAYGCECVTLPLLFKELGPDGQTEPNCPEPPSH